jgi:hypothetical protein
VAGQVANAARVDLCEHAPDLPEHQLQNTFTHLDFQVVRPHNILQVILAYNLTIIHSRIMFICDLAGVP